MKILFVCTGNTCRSPMAEAICRSVTTGFHISSAGTHAYNGDTASAHAIEAMRLEGLDISSHQSRVLTTALIQETDVVLALTARHMEAVLAMMPTANVHTLGGVYDVSDPIGGTLEDYKITAQQIRAFLEPVIDKIKGE